MSRPLRIALVAGEASGDLLGAAFIEAFRSLHPDARFVGVAGPRMRAAGCEALAGSEELSVMGFIEPLRHLPRLYRLRARLLREFLRDPPDVFVGIDSPSFNLGLARRLKRRGLPTVQYVSPQVWAWRQGRVRTMGQSVDLVLCVLPFEAAFYAQHAVKAVFVGHPLADQMPLVVDRAAARRELGLSDTARVVAVLPGSRMGEVRRLGADFAATARLLQDRQAGEGAPLFLAPMASPQLRAVFQSQVAQAGASVRLLDGDSRRVLAAADAVLVASGTATLETLLSKRPMVVAYRVAPLTAFLAREMGLVKVKRMSQPNLLSGEELVPEFLQEAVTPPALAAALTFQLSDAANREHLERAFLTIHQQLRRDGARQAALAVQELVQSRTVAG
jgi:lipid-A-disaccharide synthase